MAPQSLSGSPLLRDPSFSGRSLSSHANICRLTHHFGRRLTKQLRRVQCSALVLSIQGSSPEGLPEQQQPLWPPERPPLPDLDRAGSTKQPEKEKPLVKVQLNVHYRVHSRQMLCIGGSQIPFGWSFLSIAKVPMTWNQGDIWTCEVRTIDSEQPR